MKKLFMTVLMVLQGISGGHALAATLANFNYLNNVKAYSTKKNIRFSIDFKGPIKDYKGPVFFSKSIQVDFSEVYLNPARRKFQVDDELIKEIQAYQFKRDVVRVRFVLKHSRYDLDKNFTLESRGNKLLLALKKQPVDPLTRLLDDASPETSDAATVPAKAPVKLAKKDSPPVPGDKKAVSGSDSLPESLFQSFKPSGKKHSLEKSGIGRAQVSFTPGEDAPDFFAAGVKIYGMLFVILALFFLLFYLAKNYFFQGPGMLSKNRLIDVITTNSLGAKKSISLVEVGGEILVLGVSNTHISMLTRIEDVATIQKLKEYRTRFPRTNPLGGLKFPFSSRKKNKAASSSNQDFSSHLEHFSSDVPQPEFYESEHAASDVARLIQERLEKARQGQSVDSYAQRVG